MSDIDRLEASIGEVVHRLLFLRRMRQNVLANALDITPSVLSKKLRGESAWSARQVKLAAGVLGVPVSALYGDADALNDALNFHGNRAYVTGEPDESTNTPVTRGVLASSA